MPAGNNYFDAAGRLLQEIADQEMEKIAQVAQVAARSIMAGGILHLFGSGHLAMPSGKRLMDVVDVAIDSHVPYGDAGLDIAGVPMKVGPMSFIAGVSIVNAMVAETIEQIVALGGTPPVRISRNTPGGSEHNQKYVKQYGERIPELKL
jgi:uncharacterized phosphosugar-binding protein